MIFRKVLIFTAILLGLAISSQCGAVEIGDKAPDFSLADINGKVVSLSEYNGKVVILNFFASWCSPCRREVPDFIELEKAYASKGAAIIGVALVRLSDAKEFAGKMGINYPVLVDDGKVSDLYGPIRSIPVTFIIGKNGKISKMYIGSRPGAVFEADIKDELSK